MSMTMTEFAREIGVHYATVSRVYNNQPGVSKARRREVLAAAERMGFSPNSSARALKMQKSFAIGMVTPMLLSSYWGELFRHLQHELAPRTYGLLISPCSGEAHDAVNAIRLLRRQGVDALILSAESHTVRGDEEALREAAEEAGVPVVLLITRWDEPPFPFIGDDVVADMQRACEHLLELGHRRIALMSSEEFNPGSANRLLGCQAALRGAGLSVRNLTLLHGGFARQDGERAAMEWLAMNRKPTAIIASTDPAALGLCHTLHFHHVSIPEDVSVLGYGDSPDLLGLDTPLTTIAHPLEAMARTAVEHLFLQMEDPESAAKEILVPGRLLVRKSCRRITL